ncbi:MAG: CehA/McbA family metallohydrolase [Pyrinomonadaceae bacterium MAG19_C2-C3]|nr:CehA/McbA family metallohydrolase [Pyrinomonadaceae bacterium MAG19_C2-C3]
MLTMTRFITFALLCSVLGVTVPRVVIGVPRSMNTQTRTVERLVHLASPGANDSRYVYVPFDVPPNTARISISYQYERANGANTIDIGLFDARSTGSDTDPRGFRGWSGGRRSEFSISPNEATPGYLSGAMTAGTWRIILGLYKVAPTGVDVSFKIGIETEETGASNPTPAPHKPDRSSDSATISVAESGTRRTSSPQRVANRGARWWRGDLHMHTVHSDGNWTIAEQISSALNSGLDFICITDHNTASHHAEIDRLRATSPQLLMLRGEEITTYGGHTNAWGLPSGTWIDFRVRPGDNARMSNVVAEAHRSGALISINHPFALCGGCAWSYDTSARDFDAIEVWNGKWDITDEQALTMWDKILQSGRHITAIASSDSHRQTDPIGQPTTHVAANALTQTALLNAVRQGRVYLTGEVARPIVSFEAEAATGRRRSRSIIGGEIRLRAPDKIRFFITIEAAPPDAIVSLISNGQVVRSFPVKTDGQPQVVEIECRHDSYFRLEIRDKAKTILALTNPIYAKIGTVR